MRPYSNNRNRAKVLAIVAEVVSSARVVKTTTTKPAMAVHAGDRRRLDEILDAMSDKELNIVEKLLRNEVDEVSILREGKMDLRIPPTSVDDAVRKLSAEKSYFGCIYVQEDEQLEFYAKAIERIGMVVRRDVKDNRIVGLADGKEVIFIWKHFWGDIGQRNWEEGRDPDGRMW